MKFKGSILVYSLIVLAAMLAVVTALSFTTIISKKSASTTEFSVQSLQTADSGLQLTAKKISNNSTNLVSVSFSGCDDSGGTAMIPNQSDAGAGTYDLFFYKADRVTPVMCADLVSSIGMVKSVGTYKNTVRAVSAMVTP